MSQITQDIEMIEVAKSAAGAPWDAIDSESANKIILFSILGAYIY